MFLLKELSVLFAILFLTATGLLEISNSFLGSDHLNNQQKTAQNLYAYSAGDNKFSDEFKNYEMKIHQEEINKEKIEIEIKNLEYKFEREYLLALLRKRQEKFDESFDLLFNLLKQSPQYLNLYEELASIAKITDNLDKLSDWLNGIKDSTNLFYLYLDGLVESQKGESAKSIGKLLRLIEKGFISKEVYFQLASLYRTTGDYELSFRNLKDAEMICEREEAFLAKIINLKGTLFYLSGDYESAKQGYALALETANKNRNKVEEVKAIANIAIIKDLYGEVSDARNDFKKAIKTAEKIENNELLAFLYSELGVSFTFTNNLIQARENYEKSYSLYKLLRNNDRLSYLSSNIGSLFLQISNYKSALKLYNEGLMYAGENKLGQILNLTGIADVYSNESNYSKALKYYKRAKEIADSVKDISSIVKIEEGMGALFYNINLPLKSIEIFEKAESRINVDEMPFELLSLYSKIGTVLTSIDSLKRGQEYFLKGIEIADQTGDIYNSLIIKTELANNFYRQSRYNEALKYLSQAQNTAKEYELTQLFALQELYLGKIYEAENKNGNAVERYKSSFQLSKSIHDFSTQIEASYLLAKSFEKKSEFVEAEKWYLTAIELIEKISLPLSLNQEVQIAHFSGVDEIYNSFTNFNLLRGKTEDAFILIEKSRSRNTKTNLEKLKIFSLLESELNYNQFIDLEWMIASGLYSQPVIDSITIILDALKSKAIQKDKSFLKTIDRSYSLDITNFHKRLNDDEYLISVYVTDEFTALFNLNSKYFKTANNGIGRDSLLSLLRSISPIYKTGLDNEEIYINEDLFSFNAFAANTMYELVFKEFLSSIPKGSKLIFSFPIELVKLPVELLVTEWTKDESPYNYSNKNYLIEDYQIIYTPSLSIYQIQKDKIQSSNDQNLLIGDPFIDNTEFTLSVRSGLIADDPTQARNIRLFPLEYSEEEINSIDNTITNNIVFLSEDATENNFKQNAPLSNVIHISSHSFLLKDQPLILFSPQKDENDDGYLELGEIVQLNLSSDLVVLSSCRSGLGRIDEAEGIIGMQKAFFEAGSKSVLVSLWDVSDKYTSYFMQYFYNYLTKGLSKSDALRNAKLDFIKNRSANPYYWSAFILSGNSSAIKFETSSSNNFLYYILGLIIASILISLLLKRKNPLKKLP